jgi:tRNA-splicing ligase RtcB
MSARRIAVDAQEVQRRTLEAVVAALNRAIPTGDATHRGRGVHVPDDLLAAPLSTGSLEHAREALSRRHLGTLGGGNHFIEIDRDAEGGLWLLVHSGSRGLGSAIAHHHAKAASGAAVGVEDDLPALDLEAPAGAAYIRDLGWALGFARANRRSLEARAIEIIGNLLPVRLEPEEGIDVHHNFVARESWLGRDLLIHRKGAVATPEGTMALIPGSMGTASYVVEGLGASDSFGSCSHGAGRVMTRKQARARVRPRALAHAMRRVVYPEHLVRHLVEEAPTAYREITEVLDDQKDLVRRRVRLEPIAVLKG